MKKSTDKVLIFGRGQIGNFYRDYFYSNTNHKPALSSVDITDESAVEKEIQKLKPTVIINTAAKTNLEWIKDNKNETFNSNVLGADVVAKLCDKYGVFHIFLSSGCIFESKNERDIKDEKSVPSPQAFYSWTKVWTEQLITWNKSDDYKCLILRPRQPISSEINHKNLLIKFLTFTQYIDTPNTGTVIEDLMEWTNELMEKRVTGVVNVANEGWSTPYKIGLMLKEHVLPELEINLMTKEELDAITPVKRVDTILSVNKLKRLIGANKVQSYEKRLEDVIISLGEKMRGEDKKMIQEVMEKTMEHTKLRAVPNNVWPNLFK